MQEKNQWDATLRFSVVTVTCGESGQNGERQRFLLENMNSVRRQAQVSPAEYRLAEHLIIDNASDDDTAELISAVRQRPDYAHVRSLRLPSRVPIAEALNTAAEELHPKTTHILQLDDDDKLVQGALWAHTTMLLSSSVQNRFGGRVDENWSFGAADFIDADNNDTEHPTIRHERYQWTEDPAEFMSILWSGNEIVSGALAVGRQALQAVGGWKAQLPVGDGLVPVASQDWLLHMELVASGMPYAYNLGAAVSRYRIHPGQVSNIHAEDGTWERDGYAIRRHIVEKYAGSASLLWMREKPEIYQSEAYMGAGWQRAIA